MEWKTRYLQMVTTAAHEAENLARTNSTTSLYVAVKPADGAGAWGEFRIIRQGDPMPDGFRLLTGERIPFHKPYSFWPEFIRQQNAPVIGA